MFGRSVDADRTPGTDAGGRAYVYAIVFSSGNWAFAKY
jgi:hypothetical protein